MMEDSPAVAQSSGRSKLDSLSREDLIVFAKKQVLATQKFRSRCTDLEKELQGLKDVPSSESTLIQEVSERMEGVLLEKAEAQQSLARLQKQHQELLGLTQETERKLAEAEGRSAALQEELYQRHEEKSELQTKLAEHKESIADYKSQLSRAQEELEVTKKNWISSEETLKDENQRWVLCIKDLREELEESKDKWIRAEEALKDELEETRQSCLSFEEALAEEQQRRSSSVESLQEDLEKLMRENQGYEEEIRFLEDQLVALQDELAMKDGVLQELQEEDEEPRKQPNMMMMMIEQEELQLLRNLKLELETEIHTIREEFSLEREELEFKIHELQTHRDQETDMEPTGGKRGERHWSQSGNQHLNTIIGVHEEEPVEESCREDQQMSVVFTDERDGDTRQEEPAEESSREEPQNPEQSWCEEMECTANMTDQTVCREESCKKDEQEPDEQEVREDQKITVPGGEELLEGEAANCLKEIRALTVRTTASMLDLQELLKSLLQEQRIEKEEPCTSHEDLMRRSEEILRNLWHQETLQTAALQAQLKHARDIRLLRSELGCVSEERNSLQEQLFNVQKHISEFLLQNTTEPSEESTGEPLGDQGVCDMVSRFCCRVKELKAMEGELLLHAEKLLQEKVILKDHLEEVLSDSEVVRRNLNVAQELNLKLSEENLQLQERVSKLTHRLENIEDERKDDVQEDEPNRACRVLEECKHGEDEEMAAPVGEEAKERDEEQVPENNAGGKEEEILKSLADRDALISQLREEIHHLKGNQYSSVTGGRVEDTRASSEEMEKLKNESREKDERMNKIKAVAVKAKKELDSSRKQISVLKADVDQLRAERDRLSSSVKDIIHGAEAYKSLMEDYDRQVEQLDQEHEKLQQMEKLNQDLATQLQQREDLAPRLQALQSSVHLLESNVVELQKLNSRLECELASERILREQKSQEQQCASREVQELRTQLCSNTHALQEALQELEQLRKAAHQSSVLSVELSQLDQLLQDQSERIHDREQQLEERDALLQAAREREQRLSQEIESVKLLQDQAEERAMRMKTLLLKSKKELADAKQREASQESTLTSLRAELELQQQHLEHHKVLCSDLHRQVSSLKDELNKSSSSHQMSLRTLQQELHTAQGDLASSRSEFESYKVRVHNVLKQQKNKSSSWIDPDANRQEREQLECLLEQLRGRLQETEQNLQSSTMELEQLQHTHSTLLERHTSTLQESVSREAQLRERLLTLQAEHSHCSSHLSAQLEVQRSSSREQIRLLQEQHCRALEQLQLQTSSLETQLLLQRENSGLGTNRRSVSDRKCAEEEELQSSPREEGEGMEMIESEPTASTSKHPLPSLEELLNTHELLGACQSDRSGSENQEDLSLKLSTASKSLEHLSSLLRESEASNAILMEQTTLLKSEVRRLERNDQRKELDSNLEYLKNVVLQFVLLRPGSERQALLPVLHRLLQLSPEERSRLAAAAQGEELSSAARGSGWSSYLHSWSGIR